IAQRFMPVSTDAWKIFATERPNDFVAHHKGYVFHLTNRIGSGVGHQMKSVETRLVEVEKIALPKSHMLRPRAVHYDDNHIALAGRIRNLTASTASTQKSSNII
ncbi:hypothetical protein, partial [Reyranella sp.]|uniref:hypothetical protein n=1 Tax=Reyranella sp. TaxID=1929291 RepID=UPI00272F71F0